MTMVPVIMNSTFQFTAPGRARRGSIPDARKMTAAPRATQVLRRETRPEALLGRLAFLCGLREKEELVTARELLADFDWSKIKTEDIRI